MPGSDGTTHYIGDGCPGDGHPPSIDADAEASPFSETDVYEPMRGATHRGTVLPKLDCYNYYEYQCPNCNAAIGTFTDAAGNTIRYVSSKH